MSCRVGRPLFERNLHKNCGPRTRQEKFPAAQRRRVFSDGSPNNSPPGRREYKYSAPDPQASAAGLCPLEAAAEEAVVMEGEPDPEPRLPHLGETFPSPIAPVSIVRGADWPFPP